MLMTQKQYAAHRGISSMRVSQYVKSGFIPATALKKFKGRKRPLVDVKRADLALLQNLEPQREDRSPGTEGEDMEVWLDDFLRDTKEVDDFFKGDI